MSNPMDFIKDTEKLDKLLASLEIPEYTDRTLKADWVKSKAGRAITGTDGLSSLVPQQVADLLEVGDVYILEVKGFNRITGWLIDGVWYGRKSDQDLAREDVDFLEKEKKRRHDSTEKNREDWTRREAALPDWFKAQMKVERDSNKDFEETPMGWGYALIACELAAMYAKMGEDILDKDTFTVEDTDEIREFARENGTTGNQHGFALMLAKRHVKETKND